MAGVGPVQPPSGQQLLQMSTIYFTAWRWDRWRRAPRTDYFNPLCSDAFVAWYLRTGDLNREWFDRGYEILSQRWKEAQQDFYISSPPLDPWYQAYMEIKEDIPSFVMPKVPCWPKLNPPEWGRSKQGAENLPRRDPLILDLDGDGVKTISLYDGTHFDHNGDGFYEPTGWVDWNDGLLVMDRNGNGVIDDGKELFGDQTILWSGKRAINAFQALADLDSNKDGKIDSVDAAFRQLRVLKYSDEAGTTSPTGFLYTLDELGIKSINLDSTITGVTDEQGNTQNRVGSFEWADGAIGQLAEYSFQRDTTNTIAKEWLDIPEDIAALPDLRGYGSVYDLRQAMARDSSGQLQTLVEMFASNSNPEHRSIILGQIILKWTGMSGDIWGWGEFRALEKFYGQSLMPRVGVSGAPGGGATVSRSGGGRSGTSGGAIVTPPWTPQLRRAYHALFETLYAELMAQTHLKDLYEKLSWYEAGQEIKTDFSGVIPDLVASLNNNPEQGRQLVSEFARSLRGISSCSRDCYLVFRETMLEIDPDLGWAFDSGGLPVIDGPRQGIGWRLHINGTDGDDAVKGSLTEGDGWINGQYGDDVIYGSDRDEHIYSMDGDSLIVGGGGDDQIWAGAGNDILDGGAGADTLLGEAGNDTYIFRRGSGQDTIIDYDPTPGNIDTIFLGSSLTPEDITLRRAGDNLVLKIKDTDDTLTVKDFFRSVLNKIEKIQFMDGTVWTEADITRLAYSPTDGDDVVYGSPEADLLSGGAGNDWIYALAGNDTIQGDADNDRLFGGTGADTLDGGPGNDILDGGTGNNTYVFNRGYGQDTIIAQNASAGNTDAIALGAGVLPTDTRLRRGCYQSRLFRGRATCSAPERREVFLDPSRVLRLKRGRRPAPAVNLSQQFCMTRRQDIQRGKLC